ncbi:MAG: HAD-IIIA family hydrolase, partial [Pseudomonadota bacterium]
HPGPGMINSGVYRVRRDPFFDELARYPATNVSLERDMLPDLARRRLVTSQIHDCFFIDIGVPDQFAEAQSMFPRRRGAVFFDRDGVLNHDDGYTHRIDDLRWIDGAVRAVKATNDAGLFAFVVTNQAGIARGYYGEDDVRTLHRWMQEQLRAEGAHIDAFAYCPHHPDGVVPEFTGACERRKPGPGMLRDLMTEWPVDARSSVMIGDRETDIQAAAAAGIRGALFGGGDLSIFLDTLKVTGPGPPPLHPGPHHVREI